MKKIGGNITGIFQTKSITKNAIGEGVASWVDALTVKGWLDLSTGDSTHSTYNAKIQESTHIWLMDYQSLSFASENSRMIIDGLVYEVLLIDDPMNMHQHYEIFLKYLGGQDDS